MNSQWQTTILAQDQPDELITEGSQRIECMNLVSISETGRRRCTGWAAAVPGVEVVSEDYPEQDGGFANVARVISVHSFAFTNSFE